MDKTKQIGIVFIRWLWPPRVPLGTKLESQEQIINMPITNTNVRELQIPASANDKYAKLEIPNYKCLALSIESSPMGTPMAVTEIDAEMYLSNIFVIHLSNTFVIHLSYVC